METSQRAQSSIKLHTCSPYLTSTNLYQIFCGFSDLMMTVILLTLYLLFSVVICCPFRCNMQLYSIPQDLGWYHLSSLNCPVSFWHWSRGLGRALSMPPIRLCLNFIKQNMKTTCYLGSEVCNTREKMKSSFLPLFWAVICHCIHGSSWTFQNRLALHLLRSLAELHIPSLELHGSVGMLRGLRWHLHGMVL